MWRSFFIAIGICLVILGVESLVLDRVVLNIAEKPQQGSFFNVPPKPQEIVPRDWAPWSFLTSGAVMILYSGTLRKPDGK
jgi:hypothetical protein